MSLNPIGVIPSALSHPAFAWVGRNLEAASFAAWMPDGRRGRPASGGRRALLAVRRLIDMAHVPAGVAEWVEQAFAQSAVQVSFLLHRVAKTAAAVS